MSDENEKLEALRQRMRTYNMRTALDANGNPVLTHVANNPKLAYIALEDFLTKVEERGWELDTHSLVIDEKPDPTPGTPAPATDLCGHMGPDDTPCTDVKDHSGPHSNPDVLLTGWDDDLNLIEIEPEVPTIWMKEELADLGYRGLQQLAKLYDDVSGAQSAEALRTALEGKPKPEQ